MANGRRTAWKDRALSLNASSGGGLQATSLLGDWTTQDTRGCTLTRVIARLTVIPNAHAAAEGRQAWYLGLGMAEQDAFAAAALPEMSVEADQPGRGWIYRTSGIVVDAASDTGRPYEVINLDLRAQRKIDNAEVYVALENIAFDGTAFSVRVFGMVRLLCLLP